jgi:hypothetical protein
VTTSGAYQQDALARFQAVDGDGIGRDAALAHMLVHPDQRIDLLEIALDIGLGCGGPLVDLG